MYGRSGSIQTSRIVAPHIGQPGRSDAAGTEIVGNASIDFFTLDNPCPPRTQVSVTPSQSRTALRRGGDSFLTGVCLADNGLAKC